MTAVHKDAIRAGRLQAEAVKAYLETISIDRRRIADPKALEKRLAEVDRRLADGPSKLQELRLRQARRDLAARLSSAGVGTVDETGLEQAFVEHAAGFASRTGTSYAAFREMGVSTQVLSKAGIKRGS